MEVKKAWYHKFLIGNIFKPCTRSKKYKDFHASQISLPESIIEEEIQFSNTSSPKTRKFSTISFGYTAIIDTLKRNTSVSKNFEKEVVAEIENGNNRKSSGESDKDSAVSSMSDGSTEKKKIEL